MKNPPPGTSDRAAVIHSLAERIAAVGSERSSRRPSANPSSSASASSSAARSAAARSDTVENVSTGDEIAKARDIVYRQLAHSPRSKAKLAEKLASCGISEPVVVIVLDRFERAGLIDDKAFAEVFVRAKHRDRALGRRALQAELRRHGVADGDFAEAVASVDHTSEAERASELIDRRVDAALAAGPQTARRRLVGLLARRGYSPELAIGVVDEAIAARLGP